MSLRRGDAINGRWSGRCEDLQTKKASKKLSYAHSFVLILIFNLFVFCFIFSSPFIVHPLPLSHTRILHFILFLNSFAIVNLLFFMLHTKIVGKRTWGYNDFITRSLRRSYIVFNIHWAHHPINEWFRRFSRFFFVPLFLSSCISTIAQANLRNHLWTVLDTPADHISRLSTLSSTTYNTYVY